jgi:hypothetical protein
MEIVLDELWLAAVSDPSRPEKEREIIRHVISHGLGSVNRPVCKTWGGLVALETATETTNPVTQRGGWRKARGELSVQIPTPSDGGGYPFQVGNKTVYFGSVEDFREAEATLHSALRLLVQ